MFWRYGGFATVSTIDTLLEKSDVTLEEILDESDLIQELKQRNVKLLRYLLTNGILERLLEYVVAPKLEPFQDDTPDLVIKKDENSNAEKQGDNSDEENRIKKRNRYAYVAAEVLSSDNWPICTSLLENQKILKKFWEFLKLSPPLDPLQASYFTKVNEALLDKKIVEMLDFFKSCEGVVSDMLRHIDSPMIMDLLLKIISLEGADGGEGIIDWLHKQDLMPMLLSCLSSEHSCTTQSSAGDFLKAIITISANNLQVQQSSVGPNELIRQLVSQSCVEKLISHMLRGGNPLTVGVGIVIEVIRKNNSDYDPCVASEEDIPSTRDPIYLGVLLRLFAKNISNFMALIENPTHNASNDSSGHINGRKKLNTAFREKIEPLGFDRFKICELMAELLHCSNMRLLNEADSEKNTMKRDLDRELLKAQGQLKVPLSDSAINITSEDEQKKLNNKNSSDDDGFERVNHTSSDVKGYGDIHQQSPVLRNVEDVTDESSSSIFSSSSLENSNESNLNALPLSPSKEISKNIDLLGIKSRNYDSHNYQVSNDLSIPEDGVKNSFNEVELLGLNTESCKEISSDNANCEEYETFVLNNDKKFPYEPRSPTNLKTYKTQLNIQKDTLDSPKDLKDRADYPSQSIKKFLESNSTETDSQLTSSPIKDDQIREKFECAKSHQIDNDQVIEDYPIVGDFLKMQFVKHNVIPTILNFFFRFPWNNFLHNVVYDVVQQVFNGSMEQGFNRILASDLFENGEITMKIVNGQRQSDLMNKMRLGYMGHLTLIAEEVVKFIERNPPGIFSESVIEKIMNSEWISYVEVTLAETRERDNAILGGFRPCKPAGGQRPIASNMMGNFEAVMADYGLNGFGSNEEEEEEETSGAEVGYSISSAPNLDKLDEEVDYEYFEKADREIPLLPKGRYINDLPPPASPPPLPSLHVPPSRARLQFAARLALHKNEKIDDEDIGVIGTTEAKQRTTLDDESDDISTERNAEDVNHAETISS